MHTLEGLPILTHFNNLMATGTEEDARAIIREFFDFYDEDSPKEMTWYMLVMALKSPYMNGDHIFRSNLIHFYEFCVALFRAVKLLNEKEGSE